MVHEGAPFVERGEGWFGRMASDMDTPDPGPRRPLLAIVGGLAILGVVGGLVLYQQRTQTRLATIVACRRCGSAGAPVEAGWVVVQPGDSWAVAMDARAGFVVRGPARFEVLGLSRIALSSGLAFLAAGDSGRMVVLLPSGEAPGVEGATAATASPQSRVTASASPEGNAVSVQHGRAALQLHAGPRTLNAGEQWPADAGLARREPDTDEQTWLDQLAHGR
jgi:hypothetical protein